jgi:NhaP-type Na+/H+ and K+/H+ antiporter
MAMLVTFVFLGSALVDSALDALSWKTLLFAVFALGVARPVSFLLVLARSRASRAGRLMIAWFGPRGLASLLLMIIAIASGIPDSEEVFGIVSVVVVVSTLVHGISATPLLNWYARRLRQTDLPEEVAADASTLLKTNESRLHEEDVPRLPLTALKGMIHLGEPVTVVDIRRDAAYDGSGLRIPNSLRIPIDQLVDRINEIPRDRPVVLSCA